MVPIYRVAIEIVMNNKRVWELIGRKLAGEASAEELQELEGLLRAHPDLHFPVEAITDIWKTTPDPADRAEGEDAHTRLISRMQEKGIAIGLPTEEQQAAIFQLETRTRSPWLRYLAAAALAGILITAAAWWWRPAGKAAHSPAISEVTTRNGSRTSIQLPDGSHVWLNAGSKLTYNKDFGNNNREVNLSGEAFFDIAKNADYPFIIHTARMDVRVLGTRFNLKAYPGDKMTEATLLQGSIEASLASRPGERIILKPTEKILVSDDSLHEVKTNDPVMAVKHLTYYAEQEDAIVETSWMENKLVFRDESFASLAARMERWYGVTIQFADKKKEELRFTGVFAQENIQQALQALQMTAAFNYTIHGTEIIINQ
ncbi:FecR family protein [Chitinophaga ginsengisegetis]|uniref:FecR family protein n=1 Tax=Chitinophaga ginsengisegetis TaxID=393003 RepID=A0A1T5NJI0_9BACT|nr:FecR domain-containing protein [Chitinophaga ginsengisegetis]SKD00595.1 FecR family protein [Chitinophaga ginsengisegetis]